jgi:methyltransferase family protein
VTVLALPEILTTRFLVHDHAPGGLWSIDEATLEFLFDHVVSGARTLETGAGMSTVLFALKRACHTSIVPIAAEVARIREHCTRAGIPVDGIEFLVEASERALPRLERRGLDLVLIDGRHGFPAPMIDWYYTAPMLRVGGRLLLDDTQLWPVRLVCEVLRTEPEWRLEHELPKTAVFVKLAEGSQNKEWTEQRHVTEQTAALAHAALHRRRRNKAIALLRRGRLFALAGGLGRAMAGHVGTRRLRARP